MEQSSLIGRMRLPVLALVAMVIVVLSEFPVSVHGVAGDSEGVDYLMKYGYLLPQDPTNGQLRTQESFEDAIKQFQQMAGLNITGKMDSETIRMMGMPRCGVSDKIGNGVRARRKRYTLQGSKWPINRRLTYKISRYTPDLPEKEVDIELRRAFGVWSHVSPLTFEQRWSGPVDIDIFFAPGEHGDGNPFDGPGRTLAHAYFPQFGGDAHFDEGETWTIARRTGVNLFQVAAHEFGHSLGLAHSDMHSALMAPFYRGYQTSFRLDQDDILAIQELYGIKRYPNRPTYRTTLRPTLPQPRTTLKPVRPDTGNATDICLYAKIDAVTQTTDGGTYIFKGEYYYRLNKHGMDKGYPRKINWDWNGVTGPIDSALTWSNGYTFLFKDDKYWKFNNLRALAGYPRQISTGFRGVPNSVDGSFVWSGNGKTYFIKGKQYWRYTGYRANIGYPKPLSIWKGIPETIDGVFKWSNGRTYFFKDGTYYRYNDKAFTIDNGYPRRTEVWWLGCGDIQTDNQQDGRGSSIYNDALNESSDKADQYSDAESPRNGNNPDVRHVNEGNNPTVRDVSDDDKNGHSSALPVISSAISLWLVLLLSNTIV